MTVYIATRNKGSEIVRSESGANVLTFDATTNEAVNGDVTITDYPLDSGAKASDHSQAQQLSLSITGVITNSPFFGSDDPNRIQKSIDTMLQLRGNPEYLTISTGLRTYENMMLAGVNYSRNNAGGELPMTCRFKQVTLVNIDEVPIPEDVIRALRRAKQKNQSKAKKEQQAKKEASKSAKDKKKSWAAAGLKSIADAVTGIDSGG